MTDNCPEHAESEPENFSGTPRKILKKPRNCQGKLLFVFVFFEQLCENTLLRPILTVFFLKSSTIMLDRMSASINVLVEFV